MPIVPDATIRNRLRRQLNLDTNALPDAEIDDLYIEMAALYPDYQNSGPIMFAAVRLGALRELIVQAAAEVDHDQNQSKEMASQRAKALERLAGIYQNELARLIGEESADLPALRWGNMKKVPSRIEEYPDA